MALIEGIPDAVFAAAVTFLVVFLVLYLTFAAFSAVGFTPGEVVTLLFLAPLLGWINIPVHEMPGLILAINAAGVGIPVILVIRFLVHGRLPVLRATLATGVVTFVAFTVSRAEPGQGILVPVIPVVLAAAGASMILTIGHRGRTGPMTYTAGALGTLIGADFLHIGELVDPSRDPAMVGSIGGAGTADAIYIVALFAVFLEMVIVFVGWLLSGGRSTRA